MKNYTKVVLYTYPILHNLEEAYSEHIKNKALLSYKYFAPCEGLVKCMAEEIAKREKLLWLEGVLDRVMDKLNDTERTLLQLRYFGKRATCKPSDKNGLKNCSESTYFRMQNRLEKHIENLLKREGLTQQVFQQWFAPMHAFKSVCAQLEKRTEKFNDKEKQLFV